MSPVHAIQPTFAGGEFAPSLYARVDLAKYATGLKTCKNFFIHPHGGASNRPGTKLVSTTKFPTKKCRVVSFEFSVDQAYSIEFGDKYVRFHTEGGTVVVSNPDAYNSGTDYIIGNYVTYSGVIYLCIKAGKNKQPDTETTYWVAQSIYEVATPYLEADLAKLKFTQSADILYIVHPDYAPMQLVRYDATDWRMEKFVFVNGPFMVSNITAANTLTASAVTGSSITLTSSVDLFAAEHVGALFRLKHDIEGQAVSTTFAASGQSSSIKCGGTWRIISHGTWAGTIKIEKSEDGGSTWAMLRQFTSSSDYNVNTYGTDEGTFSIRINCTALTSGSCVVDLSSDPFEQTGIVEVTAYTTAKSVTAKVLTEVGKTTATWDWAEGSWSEVSGYPSTIIFYQDRLVFGNTYAEPQTTWMSKTGNYEDFGRSTPLVDTDGISVNLPSRKLNGINNLVPLGEILALTSATEWSIGPAQGGAVTPTSIDTKCHGYRGSSSVDPVLVGNRLVYVQPMGSVIRDLGYDYQASGYTGDDVSIFANHLFAGHSIVEMAYQQEPDSIVWCVRDDGILLSLTYLKEHDIVAWGWHETDGLVESVCSIPADGYNELWLVVNRSGSRYIERLAQRVSSVDPRKQYFVDCGISYDSPKTITGIAKSGATLVVTSASHGFSNGDLVDIDEVVGLDLEGESLLNYRRCLVSDKDTNTFKLKDYESGEYIDGTTYEAYSSGGVARKAVLEVSGYDHLNGKTVSILADGNVLPAQVVASNKVVLPVAASQVHVGLPYESDLETLSTELKLDDGTMQDRLAKISEVTFKFLNSRGGWVGPDEDNLVEIIQRTNEPLGAPIELASGDYSETLNSSYERGSSVLYRQSDPLPVTILAIMPKVTPGG
jgi:hypothetical protein